MQIYSAADLSINVVKTLLPTIHPVAAASCTADIHACFPVCLLPILLTGNAIVTAGVSYYISSISRGNTTGCTSVLAQPTCASGSTRPSLATFGTTAAALTQQQWLLQLVSGSIDTYYIRAQGRSTCTRFLAFRSCTGTSVVEFAASSTTTSSTTQRFQLVPMGDPQSQQFALRAVARNSCSNWASVQDCANNNVDLSSNIVNANNQVWRVWRV